MPRYLIGAPSPSSEQRHSPTLYTLSCTIKVCVDKANGIDATDTQWSPDKLNREDDHSQRQSHSTHRDCAEDDSPKLQGTRHMLQVQPKHPG